MKTIEFTAPFSHKEYRALKKEWNRPLKNGEKHKPVKITLNGGPALIDIIALVWNPASGKADIRASVL